MYQGWVQVLDVSKVGYRFYNVSGLGTGSRCIRVGYRFYMYQGWVQVLNVSTIIGTGSRCV